MTKQVAVNLKIIRQWLDANRPQAVLKLSEASGVSPTTIYYCLRGDNQPRRIVRRALAQAMGVKEEDLNLRVRGA